MRGKNRRALRSHVAGGNDAAFLDFNLNVDFYISTSARQPVNVFDNLPVITQLPNTKIQALDSFGRDPNYLLYIGTTDGSVLLYRVTKGTTQNGTAYFKATLEKKRQLATSKKSPVLQVQVIADISKVVALCGGLVQVLNTADLEIEETLPLKKVEMFVTEKGSPLCGIACQQKKKVTLFQYRSNAYSFEKEIVLDEAPLALEWSKGKLYIGFKTHYTFIFLSGDVDAQTELDSSKSDKSGPYIKFVADQMLLRHDKRGIFFTFSGKQTGKKLEWTSTPTAVGYRKPFAVSLQGDSLEVHNIADQNLVQIVKNTQDLKMLADGQLLLGAASTRVFCLYPRPIDAQIGQLLKAQRIDEAFNLFHLSVPKNMDAEDVERWEKSVNRGAGVALFSNLKFGNALAYFNKSDIDVREIISFFPKMLPPDSPYKAKHGLTILNLITETLLKRTDSAPKDRVKQYERTAKEMVLELLMDKRRATESKKPREGTPEYELRKAADTAIIKLHVDLGMESLPQFLSSPHPVVCDDKDIIDYLLYFKKYHALATFYKTRGDLEKALDTWRDLGAGSKRRYARGSDGVKETVDLLSTSIDLKLIFEYSKWVLLQRVQDGLSIFTSTFREEPLPVAQVVGFLLALEKGTQITAKYLEFVVYQLHNEDESYHTKLANLHLDTILPEIPDGYNGAKPPEPGSESGTLGQSRRALVRLLEYSTHYNAAQLLRRIDSTVLYEERILCHNRLGEHSKALDLLVKRLKSYNKATSYCAKYQESAVRDGTNLFLTLLRVYISRSKDALPRSVERLLNQYPQYLLPNDVIPLLPPHIPIFQLKDYLTNALRFNQAKMCSGRIERYLRRTETTTTSIEHHNTTTRQQTIETETRCGVCRDRIGDKIFVWYPNGVICHYKCKKSDHICPVTGRDFKKQPYRLGE